MRKLFHLPIVVTAGLLCGSCASIPQAVSPVPSSHLKIEAGDGVWVACDLYDSRKGRVIVISPGFLQNKRSAGIRELIMDLKEDFDVIAMDYRGHGESTGLYYYTSKEEPDLHTVLKFARARWAKVGVVGISLGAAIAINELADHPNAQSLVTISAPIALESIENEVPVEVKLLALREFTYSVHSGNPYLKKKDPISQIGRLKVPILLIHGEEDKVIFPRHSQKLYAQARSQKQLLIVPKAGHAAKLIVPHLAECSEAIRKWFSQTLGNEGGALKVAASGQEASVLKPD